MATHARLGQGRHLGQGSSLHSRRTQGRGRTRHLRTVRRRHLRGGAKRGAATGRTACGVGVKVEFVIDATGIPIGIAVDSANESEVNLIQPAVDDIPLTLLDQIVTPLIADKAYDSDPLRESLLDDGFELLSPHRKNRVKEPVNDDDKMQAYSRRWIVERTISWFHSYRRAITRYERLAHIHDGFVRLAAAFICLNRLVK